MPNLGRLVHARARFKPDDALTFVLELDPALEDVDELKRRAVDVGLARELLARGCPNDMCINSALRRLLDAEVPESPRFS